MAACRSFEGTILAPATDLLDKTIRNTETAEVDARFPILESAAARVGGFDLDWYRTITPKSSACSDSAIENTGIALARILATLPIHPSLALAALARPRLTAANQRKEGAYYTDFRLAKFVAEAAKTGSKTTPKILDPASGTGILLAASILALGTSRKHRTTLVGEHIFAADLSASALRGAALAIASLTDDRGAISDLFAHLRQADSLISHRSLWSDVAPQGFDLVIGNPPWEKLKISRHEFLRASGEDRHYGADYDRLQPKRKLYAERRKVDEYIELLADRYSLQGSGERDLYKLFLELSISLTKNGGKVALLVPAGLIRSLGTKRLREFLFESCSELTLTLIENRARFFAIDTRFKFLVVDGRLMNGHCRRPLSLQTAVGTHTDIVVQGSVTITRPTLKRIRPDLSVPEVRSCEEWKVFQSFTAAGWRFGDPDGPWRPSLLREVDMTQDRPHFSRIKRPGTLPLVEGRMVHQYRWNVKRYISGSGRRAIWQPVKETSAKVEPQFWFPMTALSEAAAERACHDRLGFCDITGQTNERTLLASIVPSGVVCGNKVPTIIFDRADASAKLLRDCWLAIANSFSFDWMLRRVITTTLNYFLLLDLSLPPLDPVDPEGRMISSLGASAEETAVSHPDPWRHAEIRAEIEWRVLAAYGQDALTLHMIFKDFPLLDRSQPALPGESRSTITRDLVLLRAIGRLGGRPSGFSKDQLEDRVARAREKGAVPFIPSHLDEDNADPAASG